MATDKSWKQIHAQLCDLRTVLERQGSVVGRADSTPARYAVRFVIERDGEPVQAAVQLGHDLKLVAKVRRLISDWQDEYRRKEGGLACDLGAEDILYTAMPIAGDYGGIKLLEYRKAIRKTAGNPLALLCFTMTAEEQGY